MSKPTHNAYAVKVVKDAHGREKSYWRSVGVVFEHKNGKGFDLVIYDQLAVSGRIVCTEPKEEPAAEPVAESAA